MTGSEFSPATPRPLTMTKHGLTIPTSPSRIEWITPRTVFRHPHIFATGQQGAALGRLMDEAREARAGRDEAELILQGLRVLREHR